MEPFDDFVNEVKSIFSVDTINVISDYYVISVNLSNETHCATYHEIMALIDLLEYYDFKFNIHKDFITSNPTIWITWHGPKTSNKAVESNIPNDIPIDTRIGC